MTATWIPTDTFGARLNLVRREKGLTVEQAAKLAGLPHPTWSTWERGARPRDMSTVVAKVAASLDVDRDWLMWGGPLAAPTDQYLSDSPVDGECFLTSAA